MTAISRVKIMVYLLSPDVVLSWVIHKAIENNYHILKGYFYSITLYFYEKYSQNLPNISIEFREDVISSSLNSKWYSQCLSVHGPISSNGESDYFLKVLKVTNFDKIQNISNASTPKINVTRLN